MWSVKFHVVPQLEHFNFNAPCVTSFSLADNKDIEQNSINLAHSGPDVCLIVEYSGLSDDTCNDLSSYKYFFYHSYHSAIELIRGMFHLDISFIWQSRVIRALVFWYAYS